ncbi:MAG: replication-associated recombination protein A [Deltaproteobacteria bacterium]|nr:replication-associated recombination protein A [Deltaproteobacteria bacterium]
MDLFEQSAEQNANAPLAERMRPATLDAMVGQRKLIGPEGIIRRQIRSGQISSLILYGPPGTGKTTLGRLVAAATNSHFVPMSAVFQGVKEIREALQQAREERKFHGKRTILFLDEIHRLAKNQQDALLYSVENGDVILVGATTENPSFEINNALLSRSRVLVLEPLDEGDIRILLERAMNDPKGLGGQNLSLAPEAAEQLAQWAGGDARVALNTLELAARLRGGGEIGVEDIQNALQEKPLLYDKGGEEHYNVISAFIKSMRGSSPDGALYWLARLLEAGEDPLFIARRMVILASEDIGNADPRALQVAIATMQAVQFIGLPEGRINLAQAATYLATAPKSNASYMGLEKALKDVRRSGALPVPLHLRNAPTKMMKKEWGYGEGYKYAHDFEGGVVAQEYLPEALRSASYYQPVERGYEKTIRERLEFWKQLAAATAKNDK